MYVCSVLKAVEDFFLGREVGFALPQEQSSEGSGRALDKDVTADTTAVRGIPWS